MKCVTCTKKTRCLDSRSHDGKTLRRRVCSSGHRFVTIERPVSVDMTEVERLQAIEKKYKLIVGLVKEIP